MKLKIFILFFITSFGLFGQLGYIPLNADYATFKGSGDKTFVEIYLSFFQQDLKYNQRDTLYVAEFSHTVKISNADSTVYNTLRNYKNSVIDIKKQLTNQFIDVFAFELYPGDYTITAGIQDKISNKNGEYILNVSIPDYTDNFAMSTIELANKIDAKGDESNFSLKNNIHIQPNASKTYTILNPILYFYFEGYNLSANDNSESNYSYSYYISDMENEIIRKYPEKTKTLTTNSLAEANGINVVALKSQPYYLNIKLKDKNNNDSTQTQKKFYVYKPDRGKADSDKIAHTDNYEEYSVMNKEQLISEFEILKYIASSEEITIFEKIENAEGMKKFLYEFWKRRDSSPETPLNEYKQAYKTNLQIANDNYSNFFKKGWKTDRGRVILIYGRPDEIERSPSTIDSQPYEVWYYYSLEGGAEFVFADLSGNGNYELLHSSYRNEIKDPDWRLRIQKLKTRGYNPSIDRF